MTFIEAPEPLLSYATNEATTEAIHNVIASCALPDDLSIADYGEWCKARLVADTVQAQHAAFTHKVWMATWRACLTSDELASPKWGAARRSMSPRDDAWQRGRFAARVKVKQRFIDLVAWLNTDGETRRGSVQLGFWVATDKECYKWSNELVLPEPWGKAPADDCRVTDEDLIRIAAADGKVDVSCLLGAARDALMVIRANA